jgi:hypothetical protein
VKTLLIVAVAVPLVWWAFRKDKAEPLPTVIFAPADPPTRILTDAAEIFKTAFWKRPSSGDKIIHAERREWEDAEGIQKWEWFIEVNPSPELVTHLKTNNAFGLRKNVPIGDIQHPPDWFSVDPQHFEIIGSGNMRLCFSPDNSLLYATDAGGGFRAGRPEAEKPVPGKLSPSGRLPLTSPPKP